MRRITVALVLAIAAALVLAGAPFGFAAGGSQDSPTVTEGEEQEATTPRVVKKKVIRPRRLVVHRARFTPWPTPTAAQVHTIIAVESRGNGSVAATLRRRIACESGFNWAAGNGPYQGLGQFHASTFARGLSSIGSRRVRWVRERSRLRRSSVLRWWSDGRVTRSRGALRRQRVRMVRTGTIPANAGRMHGWAQVRIMARAIRGEGGVRDSEWECR